MEYCGIMAIRQVKSDDQCNDQEAINCINKYWSPNIGKVVLDMIKKSEKKETGGTFPGLPEDAEVFMRAMQDADTGYEVEIMKMPPDKEFRDKLDALEKAAKKN